MTGRIFRSTFLTSLSVLLIGFILIIGILFEFFGGQIENELKKEASYIAYAAENQSSMENFLKNFSDDKKRITLISPDGKVIADTKADAGSMDNHSNRKEIKEALEKGSGTGVRYSDTLTEKTLYYALRLDSGNILRVSTTQYTIMTIILSLMQPLIIILALTLLVSYFLSARASKSIVKPINSMDLDNPENSKTYEELSPLLHKILNQKRTIKRQISVAEQKQKEFKLITDNMNEGFLVIDRNAEVLSCNNAALRLLGAENSGGSVFAMNRTESFRQTVSEVLSGKHSESDMHSGEKIYRLIANPVFENKTTAGAVIVIIDITESAGRESIRREFTANVSHELKTPLTSISGFAELMKSGGMSENTVIDFSETIYKEAQRLITLVSDIIKISELDENEKAFGFETVDLYKLSKEVENRLKPSAEKKNISLTLSGEDAEVFGSKQIIDEMIYNLLDNAIKYNRENGSAGITIKKESGGITLSVEDTGIGIPYDKQNRVFERFYRVDKSRSKSEGGTGLGLSIVKHGAAYHNAELRLDSVPDKGTTIKITFKDNKKI